jgi:mRNA-degrading endonuclease RelE of RelBE toxin-antitoxin system
LHSGGGVIKGGNGSFVLLPGGHSEPASFDDPHPRCDAMNIFAFSVNRFCSWPCRIVSIPQLQTGVKERAMSVERNFFKALYEALEKIVGSLDHDEVMRNIVEATMKAVGSSACSLRLLDRRKGLDVKRLEGEWKGFLRMRLGKVRVIFRIDKEENVLLVYEIDHRGDVYK